MLEFFKGPGAAVGSKAIEMAGRAASIGGRFPFSFEPMEFFEAHKDGVESAGGERGLLAEGVAVVPLGRAEEESFEEEESLRGDAEAKAHMLSLHR